MANEQPPPKEDKDFWDGCAGLGEGLWDSVESAATGIWDVVTDPVGTVEGLYHAVTNPSETWNNICDSLSGFWEDNWTNGDLESRSMVVGRIIGEVALCIVGTKGVDKAAKAAKATKIAKSAKAASISGKAKVGAKLSKFMKKPSFLKEAKLIKYGDHFTKKGGKKALRESVEYVDGNNYKYVTDGSGRISNVQGELKLGKGKRKPYAQRKVGGTDRLPTDDGGHLIGDQFKGSGEIDNLVPQSSNINRSGGEWYKMEQSWSDALKNGSKVEVDITPKYGGSSARPDSFVVKSKIDGKTSVREILNK